ncbi:LOW QUALITY PROTEIN: probable integral membrane protein [Psychrobacter sp. JCM 18900]|nr:LOW QUALITY PROTEIN: probable integral membrane protein [Psychrobacter sp. JCM 18900]
MLSPQDQLTELVRALETDQHVFATDPLLITEKLQGEDGMPIQKLYRRASRIDSNGALARVLGKIDGRIKGIMIVMSVVWCISGFLGLFTLLQSNVVNFFYVLVCLLGFHTIMLGGWLVMTLVNRDQQSPSWFASFVSPSYLIRGKDDVTKAAVDLYERQLQHSGMRWYLGRFSIQLWLATLTGMLLAIIFLLVVRQYSFSWESTLLSDQALVSLTQVLGWLPSMVGFGVPDSTAIAQSRLVTEAMPLSVARQWAGLLVGSLLMYGIVPRAIAWAFCALMFRRKKMRLDIKQPYYQKILNFWQRHVVDADDFTEAPAPIAPKATVSAGKKLVALLEYPADQDKWWQSGLDGSSHSLEQSSEVENFGIVDDRDDMARLKNYLDGHPVQVLLGIHSNALPDRGTLRKLDQIAAHAKDGLIVQLLSDNSVSTGLTDARTDDEPLDKQVVRYQQWQTALSARKIGLVDIDT